MGDCQIPLALRSFIEEKGKEVIEKNLYRNFVLHCCNLFEFGVVGPAPVFSAISRMQQFVKEQVKGNKKTLLGSDWMAQRVAWVEKHGNNSKTRKDFSGIFPKGGAEAKTESKK